MLIRTSRSKLLENHYTGKKGDTTEVGLGGSVVMRLTRDLVGKNHHIYMDSFFQVYPYIETY